MTVQSSRWAVAIAWAILLAGAFHLASTPTPAASRLPGAHRIDRAMLEQRAESAFAQWRQEHNGAEQHEPEDAPATPGSMQATDAYDGVYSGTATMKGVDGRAVTFTVKVAGGVGSGTQTRRDCGVAPLSLRIAPWGDVSGMVLIFGSTCLRTELAIRGRAVDGTLLLRIGSQFVELQKRDD
jgi:hypothetical protein